MRKVFLLLLCLFPHSMVVYLTKQLFLFLFRRESEWNNLHFMILFMEIIPDFSFFLWCCALRNSSSFLLVYLAPLWLSLSSFHPTMLFEGWKIYFSRKSHKKVSFFPFEMKKTSCISLGEEISSIYPSKVHSTFFYIFTLS